MPSCGDRDNITQSAKNIGKDEVTKGHHIISGVYLCWYVMYNL